MRIKKVRIYKVTNIISGKCYIGKTSKTIAERFKQHLSCSHNDELMLDILKYGVKMFKCSLIEFCLPCESDGREKYWISFYNSTDSEKGYNKTDGGTGGYAIKYLPPERKAVLLEHQRQRLNKLWADQKYRELQKTHSKGLKRSPETIEKMRAAMIIAQNRPEVKAKKRESQIRAIMNNKMINLIGSIFY